MNMIAKKILSKTPFLKKIYFQKLERDNLKIECNNLYSEIKELRLRFNDLRSLTSFKWINGNGLEIGALYNPLPYDSIKTKVKYVDKFSFTELKKQYNGIKEQYPEIKDLKIIKPDYIDDGEKLDSFEKESLDFIIANHMLEHCKNPIRTIETHLNKIKPNGILYYAIPNKDFTFDKRRELTSLRHLKDDYYEKNKHYLEWVKFSEGYTGKKEIERRVKGLKDMDYSIHYHVWNMESLIEFIIFLKEFEPLKGLFKIEAIISNGGEVIVILRKT